MPAKDTPILRAYSGSIALTRVSPNSFIGSALFFAMPDIAESSWAGILFISVWIVFKLLPMPWKSPISANSGDCSIDPSATPICLTVSSMAPKPALACSTKPSSSFSLPAARALASSSCCIKLARFWSLTCFALSLWSATSCWNPSRISLLRTFCASRRSLISFLISSADSRRAAVFFFMPANSSSRRRILSFSTSLWVLRLSKIAKLLRYSASRAAVTSRFSALISSKTFLASRSSAALG